MTHLEYSAEAEILKREYEKKLFDLRRTYFNQNLTVRQHYDSLPKAISDRAYRNLKEQNPDWQQILEKVTSYELALSQFNWVTSFEGANGRDGFEFWKKVMNHETI